MSSFVVVLDACVLVPDSLRDILLRAATAGLYRAQWSDQILEEVRRNVAKRLIKKGRPPEDAQRPIEVMTRVLPNASVANYAYLIDSMPVNPKDRHVLAAALAAKAQVIVTSNLKDFPEAALAPFSIEAQSPDHFLTNLYDLDPPLMAQLVEEQAAALRNPPVTVEQALDRLQAHAPEFARLVRAHLASQPS